MGKPQHKAIKNKTRNVIPTALPALISSSESLDPIFVKTPALNVGCIALIICCLLATRLAQSHEVLARLTLLSFKSLVFPESESSVSLTTALMFRTAIDVSAGSSAQGKYSPV